VRPALPLLHGRAHGVPAAQDLLTLEELAELADALIARGVRRIRLTVASLWSVAASSGWWRRSANTSATALMS
jgi:hypothetical protein